MSFLFQHLNRYRSEIIIALVIIGAVWSAIVLQSGGHESITVCASGCDYTSIQAAIDDESTEIGDTIEITDPVHTEGGIRVNKDVTIEGQGSENTIIQAHEYAGEGNQRVFWIETGTSAAIRGVTIRHGNPAEEPRSGGAIHNKGELSLDSCIIRDNQGSAGGGILNDGTLNMFDCTISHNSAIGGNTYYECNTGGGIKILSGDVMLRFSTVSGNTARGKGGGIHVACNGRLNLIASTISGNHTNHDGGGVYINGAGTFSSSTIFGNAAHNGGGVYVRGTREKGVVRGELHFSYTVIAGNTITFTEYGTTDCMLGDYASIGTNRYNLVEDGSCNAQYTGDPLLLPLADNGGKTHTHMPSPDSPLIDVIPSEACNIKVDQQWTTRPVGEGCDIGAVELEAE